MNTISVVAGQGYLANIWREVAADQVELSSSSLQDQQQQVGQTPEAHPSLAACLLWSNDGVKKTIKDHKKADVALQ